MHVKSFRNYLERVYSGPRGRPLSRRTARDYASRCMRLERLLRIDLDKDPRSPEDLRQCLNQLPEGTLNYTSKITMCMAMRRYYEFRERREAVKG